MDAELAGEDFDRDEGDPAPGWQGGNMFCCADCSDDTWKMESKDDIFDSKTASIPTPDPMFVVQVFYQCLYTQLPIPVYSQLPITIYLGTYTYKP